LFDKYLLSKYLRFSLLGVWPEGSDGTDINALVRSHNRKVIAVADDFCKVHLFQYPCSKPKVSLAQSDPMCVFALHDAFLAKHLLSAWLFWNLATKSVRTALEMKACFYPLI